MLYSYGWPTPYRQNLPFTGVRKRTKISLPVYIPEKRYDLLREYIDKNYEQYSGLILKKYFRTKMAEEERITAIGSHWDNKGEHEIDLIALNDSDKTAIVAEVKRNPKKTDLNLLQTKVDSIKKEFAKYTVELRGLSMADM